ncbi:MAG: hypothetical protein KGH63_02820 [Candidatus Micrarchaeota archaeon]|nr:hypothetical protein [Candidatus Micrarchaeota archaeon]
MVKANIETKNGTKIDLEGSVDEIKAIVAALQKVETQNSSTELRTDVPRQSPAADVPSLTGVQKLIFNLKEQNFFASPRGTADVKHKLSESGHIYMLPVVSTALIRLVKRGLLGRIKQEGSWKYVRR